MFTVSALALAGATLAHIGVSASSTALALLLVGTSWPVWQMARNGGAEAVLALALVVHVNAGARARHARMPWKLIAPRVLVLVLMVDPELLESADLSRSPEGNGHQNEFTLDNRFFIGTDEDFAPYQTGDFQIVTSLFAGAYPSVIVPGAAAPAILPDQTLNGPTVYGGYGCPASAPIPSPSSIPGYLGSLLPGEEKIVVLQRGPAGDPSAPEGACFPGEKAHEAVLAGWDAVLFVQRHGGVKDPPFCRFRRVRGCRRRGLYEPRGIS